MSGCELIRKRRSIRSFTSRPIPREDLVSIVDCGRYAATARGIQPFEFVVIQDKETLNALAAIIPNGPFLPQAAACICVISQDTKYYLEDGSAATQNILLAATELGIGSCWVAGDKKPYCTDVLKMISAPEGYLLVSLIALGYPQEDDAFFKKEKRPLEEILHWEQF